VNDVGFSFRQLAQERQWVVWGHENHRCLGFHSGKGRENCRMAGCMWNGAGINDRSVTRVSIGTFGAFGIAVVATTTAR